MAEAMCGPSNPLQQFKQQTALDRSLQQDRLSSRQRPSQGFRSANPNAGLLDPDFEAFQAGLSAPPGMDRVHPFQAPGSFGSSPSGPSWADDFQRMSLAPQPQLQQQQMHLARSASPSSWTQGFREQYKQSAPRASSPSPLAFQQMARYGATGFQSSFAQPNYAPELQTGKGKAPVSDTFDEAAFEKAFDLAREDMMVDVEMGTDTQGFTAESVLEAIDTKTAEPVPTQDMMSNTTFLQDVRGDNVLEPVGYHEELLEKPIHPAPEEIKPEQQEPDDEALAATAKELLGKVEHEQSDKFKNSQFLGLMRKLADRQVRVEGDKMVETADASSTVAGATLNAPSTVSSDAFPLAQPAGTQQTKSGPWPLHEQGQGAPRIDPRDGEDVVNLLNDSALADEIGPYVPPRTVTDDVDTEFMMTSPFFQS